jgi:hypothetical protein
VISVSDLKALGPPLSHSLALRLPRKRHSSLAMKFEDIGSDKR